MSDTKITDAQLIEELKNKSRVSEIANKYGMHESVIRRRKKSLFDQNKINYEEAYSSFIPPHHHLKGVSTLVNNITNEPITTWIKTSQNAEEKKAELLEIMESLKESLPQYDVISKVESTKENLLTVYPLGDRHIGLYVSESECGVKWNLESAKKHCCEIFASCVRAAPASKEAVIINLGDFFHYDNMIGVTAKHKNVLDKDGRYKDMIRIGILVMRTMINTALEKHDHVTVINSIGNHDEIGAQWLSSLLTHVYEYNTRVTILDEPQPYHFITWGKVLLGIHHGHQIKPEKLPSIMAAVDPERWGKSLHRFWLIGHVHQRKRTPYIGCSVESFATIVPPDSYATWNGYMSDREQQVIVYDKDKGEVERYTKHLI